MTDTRCANPDYQLDVDLLMLEYLLYHAIKAQFESLRASVAKSEGDDNDVDSTRKTAASKTFEAFLLFHRQFQQLHPDHCLDPGTDFNLLLFESLSLLAALVDGNIRWTDEALGLDAFEETKGYLLRRSTTRVAADTEVLLAHGLDGSYDPELMKIVQLHLLYGRVPSDFRQTTPSSLHEFPIFRLLNRFMVLSARAVQPIPGQYVNGNWMRPACQLMLHAALEAVSIDLSNTSEESMLDSLRPGILDCFAFHHQRSAQLESKNMDHSLHSPSMLSKGKGFVSALPDIANSEEEIAIGDMFEPSIEPWERMRQAYLCELVVPKVDSSGETDEQRILIKVLSSYGNRVTPLYKKYPLEKTLMSISDCLEGLWAINCMPNISGKPVLVQIEEGGLEGLTHTEFERFSERVGLKREQAEQEAG